MNPIDPDHGSLLLKCEVSLRTSWLVLKRVRWGGCVGGSHQHVKEGVSGCLCVDVDVSSGSRPSLAFVES